MPELGNILGATVSSQYPERIAQLRFNEQESKRNQAMSESKAQLLANDLDFQTAANSHDNPIINEFGKNKLREIGAYYRENPDLMNNPDKLVQLKLMKRELIDNPDLIRGKTSDSNFGQYNKDLQEVAKNPQQHDTEAYSDIQQQWGNYLQFGNQNGLEAAQKEGKKAFIYSKPKDFIDLPATMLKAGNSIKDYNVVKGKNIGEYYTEPKPDQVNAIKDSIYQQNGRQIMVEARKMGLRTPQEIDKWVSDNIAAGFNKHYSIGDPNAAFSNAMRQKEYALHANKAKKEFAQDNYTTWDDFTNPRNKAGYVNQTVARKVWGDKPPIKLIGNNGKQADLSGHDFNYDGRMVDVNGVKFLLGSVNLPLAEAEEKGIYQNGLFSSEKITSDFLDKASIETQTDKDGKEQRYVKVNYQLPVNTRDQTAKSMYEVNTMPSKLVESSQDIYNQQPKTVVQGGYTYTFNEKTGQYE